MKTLFYIIGITIFAFIFSACKSLSTAESHKHKNMLDWVGIYKGISQVDESTSKIIVLNLLSNSKYTMSSTITEDYNKEQKSNGTFTWNKSNNTITLYDQKKNKKMSFLLEEDRLTKKEEHGSNSLFTMHKLHKKNITEKYWKLIEIHGQPIALDGKMNNEPHIIFENETNQLIVTSGYNSFSTKYEIDEMNRIKLASVCTNEKNCQNMEIELLKALNNIDNYALSNDGKYLSLNKAKMAPLARFEVVYLR